MRFILVLPGIDERQLESSGELRDQFKNTNTNIYLSIVKVRLLTNMCVDCNYSPSIQS